MSELSATRDTRIAANGDGRRNGVEPTSYASYELEGLNNSPPDLGGDDKMTAAAAAAATSINKVSVDATANVDPMEPFLMLLQRSPNIARRYFRNVSIISAVCRLLDVFFLASNCLLAYNYYLDVETHYYANLTGALTIVPSILLTGLSLARAIHNVKKSRKLGILDNSRWNFVWNVIVFVLFPQIGAYYKLLELLHAAASNETHDRSNRLKPQHFHYIIHLKDESTMLYFGSNFIQSTSQFVLQGYLLLVIPWNQESHLGHLQIASLASSLLCLACATAASEQKSLLSVEWMAVMSAFLWKFFSIGSRLCILVILASVSWHLFLVFCVLHAFAFAVLVATMSTLVANKCQTLILSPLIGILYVFDDANIGYAKSFRNHLLYYTVSFAEGAAVLWVWMSSSPELTWHHYWVSVSIYTCFFLGIFFFRLFYEYNYVHLVKVPIFDCIFGYQMVYEDEADMEEDENKLDDWRQRRTCSF